MDNITATKQKDPQPISVRYFTKMKGKGRSPLQVNIKDSLTGLLGDFNDYYFNIFNEHNLYRIINGSIWGELCISI